MNSFAKEFFKAEIVRLDEDQYKIKSQYFIDSIINQKVQDEYIRVPAIGRYIQFHPFSFSDYNLLVDNTMDLGSEKNSFFCFADIEISLHFRDFFKEFARKNNGISQQFDSEYLIPLTDSSIYHYAPLKESEFTTILIVKQHLIKRIRERLALFNTDKAIKNPSVDVQFLMPKLEYSMNPHVLKIILQIKF